MPDEAKPVSPDTNPAAKGTSTSEFKVAMLVAAVSGLVGTGESLAMIVKDAYPTAWWTPLLVGVVGMLGAAASYMRSRATVKSAIMNSGTAVVAAEQAALARQTGAVAATANPLTRP